MRIIPYIAAMMALATPVMAQQEQQIPSDNEVLLSRSVAAEAQVRYLSNLVLRYEAQQKATSEWWAQYVAGLSTEKHQGLAAPGK